jgi:hypothetical protein
MLDGVIKLNAHIKVAISAIQKIYKTLKSHILGIKH